MTQNSRPKRTIVKKVVGQNHGSEFVFVLTEMAQQLRVVALNPMT